MLYEKIKSLCAEKGTSISRVEKDCGMGNAIIKKWNTSSPRVDHIIAVANCLDVPYDELLSEAPGYIDRKELESEVATTQQLPQIKIKTTGIETEVLINGEKLSGVRKVSFYKVGGCESVLNIEMLAADMEIDATVVPKLPKVFEPFYREKE